MPSNRQEERSEGTRRSILTAAGKLFSERGYGAVTIREIAKEAGCSHTTIYIYYKDKEELLHQLSMPHLAQLREQMLALLEDHSLSPEAKLKRISRNFIEFCMEHRNMHTLFFEIKSVRVDETDPELKINQLRNELFGLLMKFIQACLGLPDGDRLLSFSRIYFYMLHGIVGTYTHSEESVGSIMHRLSSTFDEAFNSLLLGFKQQPHSGKTIL